MEVLPRPPEIPMAKHFDCYVDAERREKFTPNKYMREFFFVRV